MFTYFPPLPDQKVKAGRYPKMPTLKQKIAFNKLSEKVRENKPLSLGQIMRESGYSVQTSLKPKKLSESLGWQFLMAQVDESALIEKIFEVAIGPDKRASLQAIDILLRLKDRYPANKLKVQEYQEELASLRE